MPKSYREAEREVYEWARETFPKSTFDSLIKHLLREFMELEEAWAERDFPAVFKEMADITMMQIDFCELARREGHHGFLFDHVLAKLEECKGRVWGEPDEEGVTEHVRS